VGETSKTGRVTRGRTLVKGAALSVALSVQPDVVRSLGEVDSMRARGILARWLYSPPEERVGQPDINPAPASDRLKGANRLYMPTLGQSEQERGVHVAATANWG
jgi:hypothetical protein